MIQAFFAIFAPSLLVYLVTSHPRLIEEAFYGFSSIELLWLHGALVSLILVLSLLFNRSRPVLVGLWSMTLSIGLPILAQDGYDLNLCMVAALAAAIGLLVSPGGRLIRSLTLVWFVASVTLGFGLLTVAEMRGLSAVTLAALACWGIITLGLRARQESGRSHSLLLSSVIAGTAISASFAMGSEHLSEAGFHLLMGVSSLPSLCSVLEHVFRLAYIDELTELPGRRALVETLDDPSPLFTLAMLDVDHFKSFNDTHGHDVGDQVLRMVAARIGTVTQGGSAYRYGGEEFTLYFPGKKTEEVTDELERIRELVENSPMVLRSENRPQKKPKKVSKKSAKKKKTVSVTISIGAATSKGPEAWQKVLKRADVALYDAKEGGRNRISAAS